MGLQKRKPCFTTPAALVILEDVAMVFRIQRSLEKSSQHLVCARDQQTTRAPSRGVEGETALAFRQPPVTTAQEQPEKLPGLRTQHKKALRDGDSRYTIHPTRSAIVSTQQHKKTCQLLRVGSGGPRTRSCTRATENTR